MPTANLMLNYILKPIRHESFHKKYAGKRYFKVGFLCSCITLFLIIPNVAVECIHENMGVNSLA